MHTLRLIIHKWLERQAQVFAKLWWAKVEKFGPLHVSRTCGVLSRVGLFLGLIFKFRVLKLDKKSTKGAHTVCGCYSGYLSCSPTSTTEIYTNKLVLHLQTYNKAS